MKESFDPLAEAERRSDPQLVRYNETIGHDPEANADYATYLRTRDFEDAKGNLHDAETSKFKKRNTDVDTYETDLIDSAHTEALEENTLRDSSLDTLAKKVAEARKNGDTVAAAQAEDLFYDKFTKLSEKYGWEEDDDSVNDTLRVDKNAMAGRTTVDDRLARYADIMYGKDETSTAPSAESQDKTEVSSEPVSDTSEPAQQEAKPENNSEPKAEQAFDVNAEVAAAQDRLSEAGQQRADEAVATLYESDQAQADRQVLEELPTDELERIAEAEPLNELPTDELEALAGGTPSPESESEEETEPTPAETGFLNRARRALQKGKEFYLRAAFETGHTLDLAKAELSKRGGKKEGETDEQYERRMRRNGRNLAIGIVALAGASIAAKYGAFDGLGSSNAQATGGGSGEAAKATEEVIPKDRIADHINAEQLNDFKIPEGSGGEALMNRLGTDPGVWYANQDEFLKEFPNEAYRMPDGNVGFTDPGRLSNDAIKFWSKKSGIWQ